MVLNPCWASTKIDKNSGRLERRGIRTGYDSMTFQTSISPGWTSGVSGTVIFQVRGRMTPHGDPDGVISCTFISYLVILHRIHTGNEDMKLYIIVNERIAYTRL